MRRQAASATAGFTLLELLVALTLFSLLSLSLLGGLRFASHAWQRSQAWADYATTVEAAETAIERLLAHAEPAYAAADPNDLTVDFIGTPDAVTLVASLPDAVDPGIMARQHLSLTPTSGGLTLSWQLDLPGSGSEAPPMATAVLLDGVQSLRLRFWGASKPGAPGTWHDRWQNQPNLPGLIAVDIVRKDHAALAFTVSLRVTNSSACRYYPIGPLCRRPR